MMPALFTNTSAPSIPSAKARTDARSCRSSLWTSTSPVMVAAASSPLVVLRTAKIVLAPTRANSLAVTNPRPLFAPVTITVRPENEGRSAAVHAERGLPSDPDAERGLPSDPDAERGLPGDPDAERGLPGDP